MIRVIGVKFRGLSKVYYFSPDGVEELREGDFVVVETARGQEVGKVAFEARDVDDQEVHGTLKGVLRRATSVDLTLMEKYQQQENQAFRLCREQVINHGLPMKVIRAEYNFNGTHLTFYFTAERRVDFRALVKDLARIFRTRIELRQVGVRDDVKLLGGYGRCGRPHCCATWLTEFCPISIRMAKQQDLPLSPMEISGACGRLLCCLAYENETYEQVKAEMPRIGRTVDTPWGPGQVVAQNVLQESVQVELENESTVAIPVQDLVSPETVEPKVETRQPGRRRRGTHKQE